MKNYTSVKKSFLRDRDILRVYDELGPEFELVQAITKKRLEKGLTQAELARKIKTKQSAIARLESGGYNPTLEFLEKVAKGLDARLVVSLT